MTNIVGSTIKLSFLFQRISLNDENTNGLFYNNCSLNAKGKLLRAYKRDFQLNFVNGLFNFYAAYNHILKSVSYLNFNLYSR